jgi:hypothetical protein
VKVRLLLGVSCALALAACPPDGTQPGGDGCLEPVPDSMRIMAPLTDRGIEGRPLTRTIEAPLSTCAAAATVEVEINAPGNRTIQPDGVSDVFISGRVASVQITFTPDAPGTWRVKALFPGLGSRTVDVVVIPQRDDPPTPIPLPAGVDCAKGPWLFEGVSRVACEQADASIAVFSLAGDGGTTFVPGQQLVVVGNVWWLLTPAGDTLERYEWDAGLSRTHVWPGFTWTPIRGVHTTELAVRASSGFTVRIVDTQGLDTEYRTFGAFNFESGVFFYDHDELDAGFLSSLPNSSNQQWVGIEPNVVWTNEQPKVSPNRRPFMAAAPTAAGFTLDTDFLLPPREPLVRWPVWARTANLAISASDRPQGITLVAWPNRELVRATDDVLIFRSPTSEYSFSPY